MILPKDIFRTLNDCATFLLYLQSKKQFTAEDLITKFELNKWTPYQHLPEWKNKKWLVLLSTTSSKGGKKFRYSLSKKSAKELKNIFKKFVDEYNIEESLLDRLRLNLDEILNKEQKEKLEIEIQHFFLDFFK